MKKKLCLVAMLCVLLVFMGIILAACSGVTIAQDPNSGNVTVRPAGPDKTPESNPGEGSTETPPTTPRYAVTLAPNDPAAGTVTGAGEYESGTFVTVGATTNAGYRLLGWYKGDILVSNKANYTFEMPAHDVVFTAKYEYTGQFAVTLGTDPVGAVNVSGAGVYTSGSFVTVTASSAAGFELIGWYSGSVQVCDSDSYIFEMPEHDVTLTARFEVVPVSHTVALSSDPIGAGNFTGAGAHESGTFVTVGATANDGYQFLGWYVGNVLVSNRASYVFEMPDHDVALTARFEAVAPTMYNVTLSADPAWAGTVSGAGAFEVGESVTIYATPAEEATFYCWYDGESHYYGTPYSFTMPDHNVTLTAVFKPATGYASLSVLTNNMNGGSVFGEGFYVSGESVSISAVPNEGYGFLGWFNNGSCCSTETDYTFTMPNEQIVLIANFFSLSQPKVNIIVDPEVGGTIEGAGSRPIGTLGGVTARANTGYIFDGWYDSDNGTLVSKNTYYPFIMPAYDVNLTARFTNISNSHNLSLELDPKNAGIVSGQGLYADGTKVTITATPAAGYAFEGWYNDETLISTDSEYAFTMPDHDVTLTARFEAEEPSVQAGILYVNNVNGGVDVDITYYDSDNEYRTPILAGDTLSYRFSLDASYYVLNVYGPATASFKGTYRGVIYTNKALTIAEGMIYSPEGFEDWCFRSGNGGILTISYYDVSNMPSMTTGTFDFTFDLSQVGSEKSITIEQYYYSAPSMIDDTQALNSWTIDGGVIDTVAFCRGYRYRIIPNGELMQAEFTGMYNGIFYSNVILEESGKDEDVSFSDTQEWNCPYWNEFYPGDGGTIVITNKTRPQKPALGTIEINNENGVVPVIVDDYNLEQVIIPAGECRNITVYDYEYGIFLDGIGEAVFRGVFKGQEYENQTLSMDEYEGYQRVYIPEESWWDFKSGDHGTITITHSVACYDVTATAESGGIQVYFIGVGKYGEGTSVTIHPMNPLDTFLGWFENGVLCCEDLEYTFTMPDHNVELVARFDTSNYYSVTVVSEDESMGTVSVMAMAPRLKSGSSVWINATPAYGYRFVGLYKGDILVSLSSGIYTVENEDVILTARFEPESWCTGFADYTFDLTTIDYHSEWDSAVQIIETTDIINNKYDDRNRLESPGIISVRFALCDHRAYLISTQHGLMQVVFNGSYAGEEYENVLLTVADGYVYSPSGDMSWVCVDGDTGSLVFTYPENPQELPEAPLYAVILNVDDEIGTVRGAGVYNVGDIVEIKASPKVCGCEFLGWYEENVGYVFEHNNPTTFVMPNHTVVLTAKFITASDYTAYSDYTFDLTELASDKTIQIQILKSSEGRVITQKTLRGGRTETFRFFGGYNYRLVTETDLLRVTFNGDYNEITYSDQTLHLLAGTVYSPFGKSNWMFAAGEDATIEISSLSGEGHDAPYTVTLLADDPEGGEVFGAGEYNVGDLVSLSVRTSEYYLFSGWYDGDIRIANSWFQMPDHNVTLTAKFVPTAVAYTFDLTALNSQDGLGFYLFGSEYAPGEPVTIILENDTDRWYTIPGGSVEVRFTGRYRGVEYTDILLESSGSVSLTPQNRCKFWSNFLPGDGGTFVITDKVVAQLYIDNATDVNVSVGYRVGGHHEGTWIELYADGYHENGEAIEAYRYACTVAVSDNVTATFTGTYQGKTYTDAALRVEYGRIFAPADGGNWQFFVGDTGTITITEAQPPENPENPSQSGYLHVKVLTYPVDAGEVTGIQESYKEGNSVNIKAIANTGYTFVGWYENGELVCEKATYSFSMPKGNVYLTAEFETEGSSDPEEFVYTRINADGTESETGEYILFGSYPQSSVTDDSLVSALNAQAGTLPTAENNQAWIGYGYYNGNNDVESMWYIDISYSGEKYRGVYFTNYRQVFSYDDDDYDCAQGYNGYNSGTVYWFKFEPIKWRILTEKNGSALIFADVVLDAQPYKTTYTEEEGGSYYHGNEQETPYANNYAYSTIRAWLNDMFYQTAFNELEQALIWSIKVDNSATTVYPNNYQNENDARYYTCEETNDRIFLLSEQEVTRSDYGFNSDWSVADPARRSQGKASAYSQIQGVYGLDPDWFLRSPDSPGCVVQIVGGDGNAESETYVSSISAIIPALWINLGNATISPDTLDPVTLTVNIEGGEGAIFINNEPFSGTGVYDVNESIVVSAGSSEGYGFLGWYDENDNMVSNATPWIFTMPDHNVTLTAKFGPRYTLTINRDPGEPGVPLLLSMNPRYGPNTSYTEGESLTIMIAPSVTNSHAFVGWYDGDEFLGDAMPYSFTMPDHDVVLTARFERLPNYYTITNQSNIEGAGSISTGYIYQCGEEVSLWATPIYGYDFLGWYEGETLISSNADYSFNMPDRDMSYTACFGRSSWCDGFADCTFVHPNYPPMDACMKIVRLDTCDGIVPQTTLFNYSGNQTLRFACSDRNKYWFTMEADGMQVTFNGTYNGVEYIDEILSIRGRFLYSPLGSADWRFTDGDHGTVEAIYANNPEPVDMPYTVTIIRDPMQVNNSLLYGADSYQSGEEVHLFAESTMQYNFDGWYDGDSLITTDPDYTFIMPDHNMTFVAKFTVPIVTYACGDYAEGDLPEPSIPVAMGDTLYVNIATNPIPTCTREGNWKFIGWSRTDGSFSPEYALGRNMYERNLEQLGSITLYPVFREEVTPDGYITIDCTNSDEMTVVIEKDGEYYDYCSNTDESPYVLGYVIGSSYRFITTRDADVSFEGVYSNSKYAENEDYFDLSLDAGGDYDWQGMICNVEGNVDWSFANGDYGTISCVYHK